MQQLEPGVSLQPVVHGLIAVADPGFAQGDDIGMVIFSQQRLQSMVEGIRTEFSLYRPGSLRQAHGIEPPEIVMVTAVILSGTFEGNQVDAHCKPRRVLNGRSSLVQAVGLSRENITRARPAAVDAVQGGVLPEARLS